MIYEWKLWTNKVGFYIYIYITFCTIWYFFAIKGFSIHSALQTKINLPKQDDAGSPKKYVWMLWYAQIQKVFPRGWGWKHLRRSKLKVEKKQHNSWNHGVPNPGGGGMLTLYTYNSKKKNLVKWTYSQNHEIPIPWGGGEQ